MVTSARDRFLALLRDAGSKGNLVKLTLGKYRGQDRSLRNLFIRPVQLNSGPHWSFVWRYTTRDVTKNRSTAAALLEIEELIGRDFLDAHLFTTTASAQLETASNGTARLHVKSVSASPTNSTLTAHDRSKTQPVSASAQWLRALGVINDSGHPRAGMSDKFRQIQKFSEIISHLVAESFPPANEATDAEKRAPSARLPLHVVDMGAGKGYLTFATASILRERARVVGVEARSELVELCNRVAREQNFDDFLQFVSGTIESTELETIDLLVALHACDTATDDALAKGIAAGAKLLVVSPCCQKELRRQLTAPPVLKRPLQHGIFQERQAEFVTDALRAQLLEWAGYRTRVFEFVSTEHTAKNLMITAVRTSTQPRHELAAGVREFAAFYGIESQRLAEHLSFDLQQTPKAISPERA